MTHYYVIDSIEFTNDVAKVRMTRTRQDEPEREESTYLEIKPEHARAISQYVGEECVIYVVPTSTTFDNVIRFRERAE